MRVIRLYKYWMIRRIVYSVLLVAVCVIPALVWARPPQPLLEHISSHPIINDKKCNVPFLKLKSVECMVYYDRKNDRVWLVLFDAKLNITHVAVNNKGKEELVWCKEDVCV